MSRVTSTTKPRKTDRVKYPGIVADAAALGTTRQHLWEVLQGNRVSKRLLDRYTALKGTNQ
jgi:hypothetical protein